MWQGNTLLLRAQNSAATGRRPKPVNSSHQDSVQPWPIKCTQTLPSLAKHATDRATPLSGVRKTCTRKESSLITLSGDFRLLLLISSGFRKTCNIKGHRWSQLKRTVVVVVVVVVVAAAAAAVWLSRKSQTDVPRVWMSGRVPWISSWNVAL